MVISPAALDMNNGVGVAPIESMMRAGVKVCLGNDGFSNAMWEEWKAAYLLHSPSRMFDDPHLRARDFFRTQTQQDAGTHEYVGPLWQLEKTPVEFLQPPVMFGEHNDYVYRELLGLSEAEYDALKAGGHVATEYDASVP